MFNICNISQVIGDVIAHQKRGANISLLQEVLDKLCAKEVLEAKYIDHSLTGSYAGFRECHIQPDWLLIYSVNNNELILIASRTGNQAELFDI